jgi:hypothetical protein
MELRNAVGWIKKVVRAASMQSPYLDGGHVPNLEIANSFAIVHEPYWR